jgi:hypothetical protein
MHVLCLLSIQGKSSKSKVILDILLDRFYVNIAFRQLEELGSKGQDTAFKKSEI